MEALAELMTESASAAKVLIKITAQMGDHNAFVAANASIAEMTGLSLPTVKRSLKLLQERRWINILRLGPTQSVRVIIVNDQVAWHGPRKGLRHSLFSATVYVGEAEQDPEELASNGELHPMPDIRSGEGQIPSGDGLPPPSSPALPGLEPELPARRSEGAQAIGEIINAFGIEGGIDAPLIEQASDD